MSKTRSRLLILNYITQFSLMRDNGGQVYSGSPDTRFSMGLGSRNTPKVGDLVALDSAPPTKWYLSWYHGMTDNDRQHVLESIEDGELCNWSNVGFAIYNRENVDQHPEWRWLDAQHEFNDRWFRVCKKERDAYIYLPTQARFDGDKVTLGVRVRYGLDDRILTSTFDDWRKVTREKMLAAYDTHVETLKVKPPAEPAP